KKITKMRCEFVEVSLSPPCSRLHTTGILMALKSAALVYRLFTATPLSTETERSQAILPQVTKS
ncbi:MAG: hypothetical protein VX904_07305, partial [Planctomycetota bacterium]|nr:hypothetical protein [Planctomycetota bacterium]